MYRDGPTASRSPAASSSPSWSSSFGLAIERSTELRFKGFEFADDRIALPVGQPASTWSFRSWCRTGPAGAAWTKRKRASASGTACAGRADRVHRGRAGRSSEFQQSPLMEVKQEDGRFIISVQALRLDRPRDRHHGAGTVAASASRRRSTSAGRTRTRWPPASASCCSARATCPGWSAS